MSFGVMIILILSISFFLATVRYILSEKTESFGELLIKILLAPKGYKKASMPNEYPIYTGELEDQDTDEYIKFISPDILRLIK